MKNKIIFSLICTAVLAATSSANAQTSNVNQSGVGAPKLYLQGSLGIQRTNSPSSTGMAMDLNGSNNKNNSLRTTAGIQINESFGIEGTWFTLPSSTLQTVTGEATYQGKALVLSATASLPIQKDLSLVGRLGFGSSDVDVVVPVTTYKSFSSQHLTVWGLGIRFALDESKELTFDYDNLGAVGKYALGDRVKTEMISLGLRFKF